MFKQRNGIDGVMTFTISNHTGESHVYHDVKFDHVTSRDRCCSWNYESHFTSIKSLFIYFCFHRFIKTLHQKCKYNAMATSIKMYPFCQITSMRYLSRLVGKPTICICENKGADQLRSNCEADQLLCFRYSESTIPLLLKSEISSF